MSYTALNAGAMTRIADFARTLTRLHATARQQLVEDDQIDRAFNAGCLSVWGYTIEDISDDMLAPADHEFLDTLDEYRARLFAAEHGYVLLGDEWILSDWWGDCWRILAEMRGVRTPENRAAARLEWVDRFRSVPNVIGVIVGR